MLDYGLCAVLLGFLVYGYTRGFFRQMLQIVGIGLAFFLAAKYHTSLAATELLGGIRQRNETVALVGAFVGIFFVTAAVTSVLASLLGRRLKNLHLRAGDRWLGGLLGLLVGVTLLGGAAVGLREWLTEGGAVGSTEEGLLHDVKGKTEGLVDKSLLVPYLADACLALVALVPQEGQEELREEYRERVLVSGDAESAESAGSGGSTAEAPQPGATEGAGHDVATTDAQAPVRRRLLNLGAQRKLFSELQSSQAVPASSKSAEGSEVVPAVGGEDSEK